MDGWQDEYECLADGCVVCRLRLRLGGEWITKVDVGGESEQKDDGDRRKAAVSDALKRAAVKFGVGRYLYRLPSQWCDYDPQKRQFTRQPSLPASQAPAGKEAAAPKEAPGKKPPAGGAELWTRLGAWEKSLVRAGLCGPGDLMAHVRKAGSVHGRPEDLAAWDRAGAEAGWQAASEFDFGRRQGALDAAVRAAGRGWADVMRSVGMPPDTSPHHLGRRQLDEALRLVREAAPAAAGAGLTARQGVV